MKSDKRYGTQRRLGYVVFAFVCIALISGCDSGAREGPGTEASVQLAEELLETTSEEQRPILADLEVTEEEYVDAYDNLNACLRERGWREADVERHINGISFLVQFNSPDPDDPRLEDFEEDLDLCLEQFVDDIEDVYFAQQVVPESEFPRLKEELVSCLEQHGIDGVSVEMSDGQIASRLAERNAPVAAWVCRETYNFKTGQ